MEKQGLNCGFCTEGTPREVSFHASSQDLYAGVPLTCTVLVALTNLRQTNKQTSKVHVRLSARLLARLWGGRVPAHSGWVMGPKEKLSKGTETTQEIHEGFDVPPMNRMARVHSW